MRNFEWLEPGSVSEASRLLSSLGEGAKVMAAGTSLLLLMRQRIYSPSHVVSLGRVPGLDYVGYDPKGGLRVGAMTRHVTLERHPTVQKVYPMISEMARRVANPQIRNRGTLGGNLCHGDPQSDPPACLMALGASVKVVGEKGERVIPLEGLYADFYETVLEPSEILTEIQVPPPAKGEVGVYTRFTTTPAEDRPLLGIGVVLSLDGRDTCREARMALGASTPIPVRAREAEALLRGQPLRGEVLARAGEAATSGLRLLDDFRGSAGYRREIIKVMVRRTLIRALERARGA